MSATPAIRLTTGARVIRGTRRIGALLGVIVFVAGVVIGVSDGYTSAQYKVALHDQSKCLTGLAVQTLKTSSYTTNGPNFLFAENGCPGLNYSASETEIRNAALAPRPSMFSIVASQGAPWFMFSALAAATVFALSWALGWVAAGFTAD